jgi:hypothetical protein
MQTLKVTQYRHIQGGLTWLNNLQQTWQKIGHFFLKLNQNYDPSGVTGWPSTLPYM